MHTYYLKNNKGFLVEVLFFLFLIIIIIDVNGVLIFALFGVVS
jgi:hypothetical protein